jgi:hypothetical protein
MPARTLNDFFAGFFMGMKSRYGGEDGNYIGQGARKGWFESNQS